VVSLGTVLADLEPSGHVPVHGFPCSAAGESLGRSLGNGVEDRDELRPYARWADVTKEDAAGHGLAGVIVDMTLEVDNVVSIVG
jgi:hypothetical protein